MRDKRFQRGDGRVGDISATDDDVAHRWRDAEIIEHLLIAIFLRNLEFQLYHLGHVVANQVHARAVAAILRTSGEQLRKHLGGITMGQTFHGPHVGFVERVAAGLGMARPFRMTVIKRGEHVAAHRVVPQVLVVHGVQHVRRDEDRHRGALFDVALDAGHQRFGDQVAKNVFKFLEVLYRVATLPQRRFPLFLRDVLVARKAPPVRFNELALQRVAERLFAGVDFARRASRWGVRPWFQA